MIVICQIGNILFYYNSFINKLFKENKNFNSHIKLSKKNIIHKKFKKCQEMLVNYLSFIMFFWLHKDLQLVSLINDRYSVLMI